jgi:chemotaxis response regulator CheB
MLTIIDDNPKKQGVLMEIDNKLLLGAGVENLLSDQADLYVVGTTSPDGATLLEIVKHLQPDLVILDETYFLALALSLLVELLAYPQLRIITVSANAGRVQVYYQRQLQIIREADLVHLIRGSKKIVINSHLTVPFSKGQELSSDQMRYIGLDWREEGPLVSVTNLC